MTSTRRRLLVLVAAVLVLAGVGTGAVLHAAARADRADRPHAGDPTVRAGRLTLGRQDRRRLGHAAAGPPPPPGAP
ncbi:TolB-like translocation protein, partial [Streptomyces sp. NPDC127079]